MTRIHLAEYELEATIIDTPITKKWLERFQHQELPLISNFDFSTRDKLFAILTEYESLWSKFGLSELIVKDPTELLDQSRLADIHTAIVQIQKKYSKGPGITPILNKRTNNEWDIAHDLLHKLEEIIISGNAKFNKTQPTSDHDTEANSKHWQWESQFTADEWYDSTSFGTTNLELRLTELGRHPWECYLYSPDRWEQEGSLLGNLLPAIQLNIRNTKQSPTKEYEQWCKENSLPVIGSRVPFARIEDNNFLKAVDSITKESTLSIK